MYLLDELARFRSGAKAQGTTEFELAARVDLTGELNLGVARLRGAEFCVDNPKDARSVHLVLTSHSALQEKLARDLPCSKDQYYSPGGVAHEMAILLSLFTRAHFVLKRTLKRDDTPIMYRHHSAAGVAAGQIDGSTINIARTKRYFDLLEQLAQREQNTGGGKRKLHRINPFMMAARYYHLALPLVPHPHEPFGDGTLAYIALVSALEPLLHDYGVEDVKFEDVNPEAASVIKARVSADDYKSIEKALLKFLPKKKQRFKQFVEDYVKDSEYWADSTRPTDEYKRFKNPEEIGDYAGRIYNARSMALHDGHPMPPSNFPADDEVPFGFGMSVGTKKWKKKEMLPSVRTFERVVHHVLMEYLRRESREKLGT